jgi:hypothetical protein
MKTNLLSVLTEYPALTMMVLAVASLMLFGGADNLYAEQPEYSTDSPAVLLSARDSVVRQVQRALRQRGYYAGAVDGFMGEKTQIGIQMFEVDHCHRTVPLITRWVLISLGIRREGKSEVSSKSS